MAKVQFIAYQVQTAANGDSKTRKKYPGLPNAQRDIEARCKVLADAIDAASRDSDVDGNAKKIFAAPEFFFRGGVAGVYDVQDVSYINETLDTYLADSKFQKWIFVLGTALAAMPESGGKTEILNIALVRRGGVRVTGRSGSNEQNTFANGSADSLLVYKEYVSAIDFLGPSFGDVNAFMGNAGTGGKAHIRGALRKLMPTSGAEATSTYVTHTDAPNVPGDTRTWRPSKALEQHLMKKLSEGLPLKELFRLLKPVQYTINEKSRTGLGGGIEFDMSGIHFALEICLDHLKDRAFNTVDPDTVDVHLVTSCGMTPQYYNCKDGGFFFQVDGINSNAGRAWAYKSTGSGEVELARKNEIDMNDRQNWRRSMGSASNLFEGGKGTVVIFEAGDLP